MSGAASPVRLPGGQLLGRRREREVFDRLLEAAHGGDGRVLVVHGEPGVGKSALLEYAVEAARGFRVARTAGVEAEMELPFAALQQLCSPFLELTERLPEPHRAALGVAFGIAAGSPPNLFLVGLAVLGLLSEVAEEQPLLCVIDDAQWLDGASARSLAFVARRLVAEKIALVFATREPSDALKGLPEVHVKPLGRRDARALLESVLPARVDESVLDRIVEETRGNPLALLELPQGLTPTQLAGGFGLPPAVPLSASIEESFTRRLAGLPGDARRLLLLAAADPVGDPALVWRAAEQLGIPDSAADSVEAAGLLTFDGRVVFRHPLVRSAAYGAAGLRERRDIHRALAGATDPDIDPDRRAWHRAHAAPKPDEEVAAELDRSAARAQARGGFAAAAAFLERSSVLTPEPARKATRALAAAEAQQQAGALEQALALAADAASGPLDELQQAQVDVLRARISFATDRGSDAPRLLLTAAKQLEPLDGLLAREVYLDALTAAVFAGRLARGCDARQVAAAARAAPPATPPPRPPDLLLDGLARLISDGPTAGTAALRTALSAFHSDDVGTGEGLRWLWLAGRAAGFIWDYEDWDSLTGRQIRAAREAGALAQLPLALSTRVGVHMFAGELQASAALVEEADALAEATDGRVVPAYGAIGLAAFRGREDDLTRLVRTATDGFIARGEGMAVTVSQWLTAVLYNGMARYEDAFAAAEQAAADPRELWFANFALVELIEAATRSGRTERAAEALDLLVESTRPSGTPWALSIEARSRALLGEGEATEALYRQALEHLQPTRLRLDLARAHLLYGEWLRRERRRTDARIELRTAHELFCEFGMEAFAERARIELEATGERARKRTVDTLDQLTPQETQIARLAAEGSTNREIAAQLFISPSTVEYHLHKVFRKLEVKSRTQLAQLAQLIRR
ncbi:MAG TPA: LuxR C-terminal-related transcriptional regulator [Thermoleophilaceae bacterium]